jgi:hypothetical protein
MGVRPAAPNPIGAEEMRLLISRTGLSLNQGELGDLVLTWRGLAPLLGLIPRDRPLADDFASVFRLPPPAARRPSAGVRKTVPRRR